MTIEEGEKSSSRFRFRFVELRKLKSVRSFRKIVSQWKPTEEIPVDSQKINYQSDLTNDEKKSFDMKTDLDRIPNDSVFLVRKRKIIGVELKIIEKFVPRPEPKKENPGATKKKMIFSQIDLQTWFYTTVKIGEN